MVEKEANVAVFNIRSRLVTFRVTQEEYAVMWEGAKASGNRSISDFTRMAVLRYTRLVGQGGAVDPGLDGGDLSARMERVEQTLMQMQKTLAIVNEGRHQGLRANRSEHGAETDLQNHKSSRQVRVIRAGGD